MTQKPPTLITFGFSHFCEKARWALDWHGIGYNETGWPPGLHVMLAKRCGAKSTTLPILLDGRTVIQGSGAIIDWAESKAKSRAPSLTPQTDLAEAREIERRADEVIGIHARRLAFAEMLPHCPYVVKSALFLRVSGWHRVMGDMMWPVAQRIMMKQLDVRPGAAADSRAKLETELDWLDAKLADGRCYLAGGRFSRADLTVASLLAGFARPKEMAVYHDIAAPDGLAAVVERWSERPVMHWVATLYRVHRHGHA